MFTFLGSGVLPGQGFGIEPRLGKKKETERSGNKLSDPFPVDRIPIQFKGLIKHSYIHIIGQKL